MDKKTIAHISIEVYLAVKKNELLKYVTTGINLKCIYTVRDFLGTAVHSDRKQLTRCKELAVGDKHKRQPQGCVEVMDVLCIMTTVMGTENVHFSICIELCITEQRYYV